MLTIPVNGLGLALRDFYRDWKISISQSCKIRANDLPCFQLKPSQCLIVDNPTTVGNRRSSLRVVKCNTYHTKYVVDIYISWYMIHVADIHNRSKPKSCCLSTFSIWSPANGQWIPMVGKATQYLLFWKYCLSVSKFTVFFLCTVRIQKSQNFTIFKFKVVFYM